jgi:1-phosphofructokinase
MIANLHHFVTVTLNPAIDRTLVIRNFAAGRVHRVESETSTAGGKGVNVASCLARAGHHVAAAGFLGRENAAVFEALFSRLGIADRFVRIGGSTRSGIKVTDPELQQTTDINFPGAAPSAADSAALREVLGDLQSDWFVLAGSLPPGVPPFIYRELTTGLKAGGVRVAVDASGEPLRLAIEAAPDLIKPNVHELEELTGRSLQTADEVLAAARRLVAEGIGCVVVSMGAAGACFVTRDEAVIAVPPALDIRTTVGAGDAMVAGTLSSFLRGRSLADTARFATAFSLRAISVHPQPLEALAASVSIQKPNL